MSLPADWMRTIHVALPTPFDPGGKAIVPEPLEALVSRLVDSGISVFLPAAANGEYHSLSEEEVITCVRLTAAACGDRGLVVAPIGFDVERARRMPRAAADAGAQAVLYMPPIHPYLSDQGFELLLRQIDSPLPLMVYKKGPVPSDDLLVRLVREGVVSGVKYSGVDAYAVSRFIQAVDSRSAVICGTGERFAPFFALAGAVGFSSGIANVAPRLALKLLKEMTDGAFAASMDTLARLRPLEDFRARDQESFNIPGLKEALRRTELDFGPPRPPQRVLTPSEETEISRLVDDLMAAENALGNQ